MTIKEILQKFNVRADQEDHNVIHETVESSIYFRSTNLWVLFFAILIACVGLNVNSTAVVIGAMLISPLMGPIIGVGYGLATYDFGLMKKAFVNFGFAVLAGLTASTIYFSISPLSEAHSELLSRTQPNIYDVIIALAGGFAGIIALSSKQKGNVIPGVAIATALMPPLCTAGYGLASGSFNYFFGAVYLFTINSVFIATATLITARVLKYPKWHYADEEVKKSANRWVSIIVIVTMTPSLYFGYMLVQQERFNINASNYIRNETYIEGDYLLKSEVEPSNKTIKLIYGGKLIPDKVKQEVASAAKHYGLDDAKIIIQQGFSLEQDEEDLLAMNTQQAEINKLREELARRLAAHDSLMETQRMGSQLLRELKPLFPDIQSCGTAQQTVYADSAKSTSYFSIFLGSGNLKKTLEDKPKIEEWLRSRIQVDSVKVYIE